MSTENIPDLSAEIPETLSEELQEIDEAELAASLSQLTEPPGDKLPSIPETSIPETPIDPATELLKEQIASLTAENDTLQQQFSEAKEQYRRLYADFDNFRKRVDRDKQELENRLAGKFLERLLPTLDDFERAQSQIIPKSDGEAVIHRSYQSIYKQLQKFIKDAGVTRMETVGNPFDPVFHEAIAHEPSPDYEENIICVELRAGYLLGDRVLRPALVKVSSQKISPEPENVEEPPST